MEIHVLRVDGKLVEHVAAAFDIRVVGKRLRQQRYSLRVIGLRFLIIALKEVKLAQAHLIDGLVDAVARRFFVGELIILDGAGGVAAREVEIADGIIYLVEIFLVAVVAGHAAQGFDLRLYVGALENLALLDSGIEFCAVWRRR